MTVYCQELEDKVSRFCVYALTFYIPTFFKSSQGCDAPSNNLKLYKDLLAFRSIDETLTAAALATMDRNCWYLAFRVVMFSLFSKQVTDDTKARMVAKLLTFEKPEKNRVGLQAFPTVTGESQLWDFVMEESWDFFKILKVPVDLLTWPDPDMKGPILNEFDGVYQETVQKVRRMAEKFDPPATTVVGKEKFRPTPARSLESPKGQDGRILKKWPRVTPASRTANMGKTFLR